MNYFDPNVASPLAGKVPGFPDLRGGLVFVGVDGRPRSQYIWDKNNIAPRFGFAYLLTEKTTIRGGWAISMRHLRSRRTGTVGPFGFRTQTPWVGSVDGITPNDTLTNPYPRALLRRPDRLRAC